jgi:hypothetical protein
MPSNNIFAIDVATDKLVLSNVAPRHRKYKCCDTEECGAPVFLKRGKIKAAHFAHYPGVDGERCPGKNGGETREHFTCKHHVANNIKDYEFVRGRCRTCHFKELYEIGGCTAHVETRIPGCSRIADVLLRHLRGPPSSVEVLHSHACIDKKRAELDALNVPIIEVSTEVILDAIQRDIDDPYMDGPRFIVKTIDYEEYECANCEHKYLREIEWEEEVHCESNLEKLWKRHYIDHTFKVHGRFLQRRGLKRAVEAEQTVASKKTKYQQDKIVGKCTCCNSWMFDKAYPTKKEMSTGRYCETEWTEMNSYVDPKYVVSYRGGRGIAKICERCTVVCVGCSNVIPLSKALLYGSCNTCYIQFGLGNYLIDEEVQMSRAAMIVAAEERRIHEESEALYAIEQATELKIQEEKKREEHEEVAAEELRLRRERVRLHDIVLADRKEKARLAKLAEAEIAEEARRVKKMKFDADLVLNQIYEKEQAVLNEKARLAPLIAHEERLQAARLERVAQRRLDEIKLIKTPVVSVPGHITMFFKKRT